MVDGMKISKEAFKQLPYDEKFNVLFDRIVDISDKMEHRRFANRMQVLGMGFLGGFTAVAAKVLLFWK